MSDISATMDSESAEIVPGWKGLLDRLDAKDERIAELEEKVEELESELADYRESAEQGDGPSRAEQLVDALRRTAQK